VQKRIATRGEAVKIALTMKIIPAALALLSLATLRGSADYILSHDDAQFLHDQAMKIVAEARVAPGDGSQGEKNTTPYVMEVPDGPRAYNAFFCRDSNMALGADFVSLHDVEDWIRLASGTVLQTAWQVRPGISVPAWTLPDHIYYDGKAGYWPGPARGNDMGGGSFQAQPPLDDTYFFLFTVCQQAQMAGNLDFFKSKVPVAGGEMPLCDLCLKIFDASPVDPATGLVQTGDIDTPSNAHDFGFCDGVAKSGKLLFTSVLRYDAAKRLAPLYLRLRRTDDVFHLMHAEQLIKLGLARAFYHDSAIPGEGWLHSATNFSNQPDVWGSAYAVEVGAMLPEQQKKVALSLLRGYRDHSLVINGWVTQVLMHDPAHPSGWMRSTCNFGDYQNGGYWGTGTGWYILALNTIDPAAARQMAADFVKNLRANMEPDGATQAWEVINGFGKNFQHAHYVATVAFPYGLLNRAGLLDPSILHPR
jgi:hypothetical protein